MSVGTLALMLFLYANRIIKVTQKLAIGIVAATGALALVYLVSMVVMMFGRDVPFLHSASPVSICFSLFVVGLAAFATVLALPFFLLAFSPGLLAKVPKSGDWMNAVKVGGGLVEVGAGAIVIISVCQDIDHLLWDTLGSSNSRLSRGRCTKQQEHPSQRGSAQFLHLHRIP